ncbi:MAG: hypothetical protein R2752_13325 [Vicinamibacterales bacterium]
MFAINHAATALLLRRKFPDVSLVLLLLSVQVMELAWVALNYVGLERTTTEPAVRFVGDIHLAFMPYSHSIATMAGAGVLAVIAGVVASRPRVGLAVGLGIVSHLVLDLATHDGDIALAPGMTGHAYGTFLYAKAPALAFAVELGFGLLCWRVFRGGAALLAVIVGFNLANLSLFFASVPGPERWMAGRPGLIVSVILVQIVVTLWAVGWGARRAKPGRADGRQRRHA